MVHGHVAAFLLAVLKQRELRHPEQVVHALGDEAAAAGDLDAQRAQALEGHRVLVGHEEEYIARLGAKALAQFSPQTPA